MRTMSKCTVYTHCYASAVLLMLNCLLTVVPEQRRKEVLYCQVRVFPVALLKERMGLWSRALLMLL